MFQVIYNVVQSFSFSVWSIIMTIITGKMVKISHYHLDKDCFNNNAFDICSDKYIKTDKMNMVTDAVKKQIINHFIAHLSASKEFLNSTSDIKAPIFDGKDIIGTKGLFPLLDEEKEKFIQSLKN
jgi:hypothetical protein